eukprot:TRINITY_DN3939_c0_g1_i1.p3 TRINITY_DN3939_c0_g1~~TRINITY_DN3939_c0_g1_i1.p3  ORF type:complete len:113 (+),score=11.74 TRINITY_DN3939_c0_g1_i1:852-1190(+)
MCYSVVSPSSLDSCYHKWQAETGRHCPEARIILVGLKKDLRDDTQNFHARVTHPHAISTAEGQRAMRELGCVNHMECSALTQEGLDALFVETVRVCCAPAARKKKKPGCTLA